MQVLVTRPIDQGSKLCRAIEAHGGIAHHCAMLDIVPLDPPAAGWWQGYDWLIFISTNAVRFALSAGLPHQGPFKTAVIGKATAQALEDAGLEVDLEAPPPHTSEALLAQAPFQEVLGQRVLIVKGAGGRSELADTLTARGAYVQNVELYRRQGPSPDTVARLRQLLARGLDAILASSAEIVCNLQAAAGEQQARLHALPLVVGGARLAREARGRGFTAVIEAFSPTDEAMVEALLLRFGRQ